MTLEAEVLRGDRPVLIDTGGWLAYLSGGEGFRTFNKFLQMAETETCFISAISITPIFEAISGGYGEESALEVVHNLSGKATVVPFNQKIAVKTAETMMKENLEFRDAAILATAILLDAVLLTDKAIYEPYNDVILVE